TPPTRSAFALPCGSTTRSTTAASKPTTAGASTSARVSTSGRGRVTTLSTSGATVKSSASSARRSPCTTWGFPSRPNWWRQSEVFSPGRSLKVEWDEGGGNGAQRSEALLRTRLALPAMGKRIPQQLRHRLVMHPDIRIVPTTRLRPSCHQLELQALPACGVVVGLLGGEVVAELGVRAHRDQSQVPEPVQQAALREPVRIGDVLGILGAGGEVLHRGAIAEGEVPLVHLLD